MEVLVFKNNHRGQSTLQSVHWAQINGHVLMCIGMVQMQCIDFYTHISPHLLEHAKGLWNSRGAKLVLAYQFPCVLRHIALH